MPAPGLREQIPGPRWGTLKLQCRSQLLRFFHFDPFNGFVTGVVLKLHFHRISYLAFRKRAIGVGPLKLAADQVNKSALGQLYGVAA